MAKIDRVTVGGDSLMQEERANEVIDWINAMESVEFVPSDLGTVVFPGVGKGGKVQIQLSLLEVTACVVIDEEGTKEERKLMLVGFLKPKAV